MNNLALFLFFSMIVLAFQHAKAESPQPMLTCTNSVINNVYIPKLREVVDWPDSQIRPYAKQLCQLDKQKESLQKSIKARADELRTTNWRICKEVIPGNPNPTDAECQAAYAQRINDHIDQCISLVSLGHNPHNVMLFIDPAQVEVACLKGTNTSLQ
ncbi:hypothetical protein [Bdellovibrio sp. NC01]|uniref:hypothetical protein n=1 Tax=Bdellovibrio sp. NC01 TaxID=2220073 RepID=UPI0011580F0C|nr:hypothetical protein [Bdellovibrio sp. NC01]QDK36347.1 hypothetical protein DOE51_01390 [Bdellovibrio sp. NC01]